MTGVNRRDFLRKAALVLGATGVAGMAGLGQVHAPTETAPSVPRPGNFAIPASYLVFQENGKIYAQNGKTGFSDYSGTDAATVIGTSLASLIDGGLVFVKKGTYLLTERLLVKSNVELLGERGARFQVEKGAQSLENPFNILDIAGSNVTIEGLEFDGNTANNPNIAGTTSKSPPANPNMQNAITVSKGSWVKIRNCFIHDTWNAGIWLTASLGEVENVEICGCHLESTGLAHEHVSTTNPAQSASAIYSYRMGFTASKALIHGNFIKDTYGRGIYLHFDTDSIVTNNTIASSRMYVAETGGIVADHFARRLIIKDNRISGYSPGISCVWQGSEDLIVAGNYCANAPNGVGTGFGITVSNTTSGAPVLRSVIVSGNICKGNARSGIYVAASDVLIQGNICYDNNRDSGDVSTRRAGILIQGVPNAVLSGVTITGNRCFDSQVTKTQDYGVAVSQADNEVKEVVIVGNDLRGNRRGAIGELTCSSFRLAYNLGYNPPGMTSIKVDSSPFVYENKDGLSEVLYISGGVVTEILKNDEAVFFSTPATVWVEPGDTLKIVHADPPRIMKDRR